METKEVKPGDVVVTNFGIYQHYSLVSDKKCKDGMHMLISATKRNGTVKEESWSNTTENKNTYVTDMKSEKDTATVLNDARSMINIWKYSLSGKNCEHFVRWSLGLKIESVQVNNTIFASLFVFAFSVIVLKRPTLLKLASTTLPLAGLVLASTKALEKK